MEALTLSGEFEMTIDPVREYVLKVSSDELRLIGKALGGRLKPEDVEPAKRLDRAIAEQRVAQGEHDYKNIQKLKQNLAAVEFNEKVVEPEVRAFRLGEDK